MEEKNQIILFWTRRCVAVAINDQLETSTCILYGVDNDYNNYVDVVAAVAEPEEPFNGVFDDDAVVVDEDVVEGENNQQGSIPPAPKKRRTEQLRSTQGKKNSSTGKHSSIVQSTLPSFLSEQNRYSNTSGNIRSGQLFFQMPGPSNESNTPCSSGVVTSSGHTQANLSSLTQTSSVGNISSQRSSSLGNNSTNSDVDVGSTTEEKKAIVKKSFVWSVCVLDNSRLDDIRIKCVCGWSIKYF